MRTGLLLLTLCGALGAQNPLALLTEFERPASTMAVATMHEEVARIMAPLGWRMEWHALADAPAALPRFVIVSFKGVCRIQTGYFAEPESSALATTLVSGARIMPFSSVECDKIRTLLPSLRHDAESEIVFGRALGRVIAHELYHVLLQTKGHADHGVAHSFQTTRELTAAKFGFDELSAVQLRTTAGSEH